MSDIIGKYNLRPAVKGDTWDGAIFTIKVNNVAVNITGYAIEMRVELPGSNTSLKTLTVANAGIAISDAPAGEFRIVPFIMDLEAKDYEYRIILTDGLGRKKTRIKGTWKIIEA